MEGGQATSATAVPGFSAKERERLALRIRSSRIRVLIHSLFALHASAPAPYTPYVVSTAVCWRSS